MHEGLKEEGEGESAKEPNTIAVIMIILYQFFHSELESQNDRHLCWSQLQRIQHSKNTMTSLEDTHTSLGDGSSGSDSTPNRH